MWCKHAALSGAACCEVHAQRASMSVKLLIVGASGCAHGGDKPGTPKQVRHGRRQGETSADQLTQALAMSGESHQVRV